MSKSKTYRNDEKELHRTDGPAVVCWHDNGVVEQESYYVNGNRHREDGPAVITYNEDGTVIIGLYYVGGKLHREDGPAVIGYYADGSVEKEYYYSNDKLHRGDGPAVIFYGKMAMYNKNTGLIVVKSLLHPKSRLTRIGIN